MKRQVSGIELVPDKIPEWQFSQICSKLKKSFLFMKRDITFITLFAWLFITAISCTDEKEKFQHVEPGVYNVGKDLSATHDGETRGIGTDYQFDLNYEYDYIYLHKIGTEDKLYIPVHNNCENTGGTPCKGFRYRVEVDENGTATITPLDSDGQVYGTETLTLEEQETCYFSSWENDEWVLPDSQIAEGKWGSYPNNESYYFYYRDKEINKEIYRSGNTYDYHNLSIAELTTNGDLFLTRACSGFSAAGLLYDKESKTNDGFGGIIYPITSERFSQVMGDTPEKWYIKIYVGGTCFPDHYNIENNTASNTHPNGYYSSGDVDKFENGQIVGQEFLPFSQNVYGNIAERYQGYGYLSNVDNLLFSPVNGEAIYIYILIKHWFKTGEPDVEWLTSDIGALQTTLTPGLEGTVPRHSNTYTLGVVIDINQFKAAWEAAGGDKGQEDLENSVGKTSLTRSPSGAPVREFKLDDQVITIKEIH